MIKPIYEFKNKVNSFFIPYLIIIILFWFLPSKISDSSLLKYVSNGVSIILFGVLTLFTNIKGQPFDLKKRGVDMLYKLVFAIIIVYIAFLFK